MKHPSPEMQQCIDNCQKCHAVCLQMLSQHCLEAGGEHVEPSHVRIMLDCLQICQVSADFMLRGSEHHAHICGACAEICGLRGKLRAGRRHGRLRGGLPRLRANLRRDGPNGRLISA